MRELIYSEYSVLEALTDSPRASFRRLAAFLRLENASVSDVLGAGDHAKIFDSPVRDISVDMVHLAPRDPFNALEGLEDYPVQVDRAVPVFICFVSDANHHLFQVTVLPYTRGSV